MKLDLPDVYLIRPEVRQGLSNGQPVVALESAVITHGLPRPANLELALSMEAIVRGQGAIPAT
ncbi:MAG TPA: pseudouridine-5'-phosphate glycosidase, partial [Anaerolineaceae bacterium]|nr:pseudouridine-5'-phosphate glycosidase [Anaerolineaceae bacterium]